jgi:agmatine deiminase
VIMWTIPPEYSEHHQTWMAYPWDVLIWGQNLAAAQRTITNLIQKIAIYERVCLLVPPNMKAVLTRKLKSSAIEIIPARYNDIWLRDTLPTFAVGANHSTIAIDWHFNGWGKSKGVLFRHDKKIGREVARMVGATVIDTDIVAEGGAFVFDGDGVLVTTESVLSDWNRNKGPKLTELRTALLRATQCRKICFLEGDEDEPITRGHSDGILAFGKPNIVLFNWVEDEACPERQVCERNLSAFTSWTRKEKRHYEIVKLPSLPRGKHYCASYINFIHVNGAVVAPEHGGRSLAFDNRAKSILQEVFGKPAILVPIAAIAAFGGGVHCATNHIPRSVI